jgi:hypothetical protein
MRQAPCGFCAVGLHDRCPGAVRNGNDTLHFCGCVLHQIPPRCLDCGTPGEWKCPDLLHCVATISRRVKNNPQYQLLRECVDEGRRERMERSHA